jgi:hypothetical protein
MILFWLWSIQPHAVSLTIGERKRRLIYKIS